MPMPRDCSLAVIPKANMPDYTAITIVDRILPRRARLGIDMGIYRVRCRTGQPGLLAPKKVMHFCRSQQRATGSPLTAREHCTTGLPAIPAKAVASSPVLNAEKGIILAWRSVVLCCLGLVLSVARKALSCPWSPIPLLETRMARPKKETISKLDAMRQAVAKLGKDAPLADLLKTIKQDFGITLDRGLAYNYKSLVSSKPASGKRKGRKPGRKPKAVATAAAATNGSTALTISVEDIAAVKALADRIGAEKVQALAKVLAK
jgi:hypothetical protein